MTVPSAGSECGSKGLIESTHRWKGLAACGSVCEDDVRIIILVYTEETLKGRVITDAARDLKTMIKSAKTTVGDEEERQHTVSGS
jgi:hypothetical protein